ncbi:hypothetical protein N3K66_004393 [Trichothecium roseum]|uniref:Uncharacterized protein n=1 Tax=Trichothecium roseum TaxID=47278 RepID=A0ACC0V1V7_9HYPO|nr:hypothetical protein N3K66_004393 [Trichothecium roseum]
MIETDNLRTASLYINNQLLSRGLLADGHSIDFANPVDDDGDATITMGRIMRVVNDLILRRDRDAEHRESLSATMRNLKVDNTKHATDITRLKERHAEAQRKLDIAESSESALRTQLKSADAAVKSLKDEVVRTKALVAQARSSCATEVRRRDRQLDAMKKQLGEAGRARGSRGNPGVTTITVTGDFGAQRSTRSSNVSGGGNNGGSEYNLRSETNAFLANLAGELSEENEAILTAVRRTVIRLRQMSGYNPESDDERPTNKAMVHKQLGWQDLEAELDAVLDHMKNLLTNPSFVPIEEVMLREEEINRLKNGWVKMENRWKEAVHLIDGWRKRMAASGRPVNDEDLQMGLSLSPVRVKGVAGDRAGNSFDLSAVEEEEEEEEEMLDQQEEGEELYGEDEEIYGEGEDEEVYEEDEDEDAEVDMVRDDGSQEEYEEMEEDYEQHEYEAEAAEDNFEVLQESTSAREEHHHHHQQHSSPLPEPPQISPLKSCRSAGNILRSPQHSRKRNDFSPMVEHSTIKIVQDDESLPPPPPPHRTPLSKKKVLRAERTPRSSLDDALLGSPAEQRQRQQQKEREEREEQEQEHREHREDPENIPPRQHKDSLHLKPASKLPRLSDENNSTSTTAAAKTASQQSPLTMATIAAKLAASEREADAARVRAKLRAMRGLKRPSPSKQPPRPAPGSPPPAEHDEDEDEARQQPDQGQGRRVEGGGEGEDVDPVKRDPESATKPSPKPEKRKREKRRRSGAAAGRRRSTLSPWELESLMQGSAA